MYWVVQTGIPRLKVAISNKRSVVCVCWVFSFSFCQGLQYLRRKKLIIRPLCSSSTKKRENYLKLKENFLQALTGLSHNKLQCSNPKPIRIYGWSNLLILATSSISHPTFLRSHKEREKGNWSPQACKSFPGLGPGCSLLFWKRKGTCLNMEPQSPDLQGLCSYKRHAKGSTALAQHCSLHTLLLGTVHVLGTSA